MRDEDINKIASKLAKSLATKKDVVMIKKEIIELKRNNVELKKDVADLKSSLEDRMDLLDDKADTILKFAEAVDETTDNHGKGLKRIEAIPVVAHQLKIKKS